MTNFRLFLCVAGLLTYLIVRELASTHAPAPHPNQQQIRHPAGGEDKLEIVRQADQLT